MLTNCIWQTEIIPPSAFLHAHCIGKQGQMPQLSRLSKFLWIVQYYEIVKSNLTWDHMKIDIIRNKSRWRIRSNRVRILVIQGHWIIRLQRHPRCERRVILQYISNHHEYFLDRPIFRLSNVHLKQKIKFSQAHSPITKK